MNDELNLASLLIGAAGALMTVATVAIAKRNSKVDSLSKDASQMKEGLQLLASEQLEIRIGALHFLGLIAHRNDAFYVPIMDTLCAYVRRNAHDRGAADVDTKLANEALSYSLTKPASSTPSPALSALEVSLDIDIALRIIGGGKPGSVKSKFDRDLSRCDLRRYVLHGDFSNMNFRLTKLDHSLFSSADISSAKFWNSSLDFAGFTACKLHETKFMHCSLNNTVFQKCELDLTHFSNTPLQLIKWKDCAFRDIDSDRPLASLS